MTGTFSHRHIHTFAQRYELKGSMLGRIASSEERKSPTVVLKDIDLMISHKKFVLGKDRKQEIVKQASFHEFLWCAACSTVWNSFCCYSSSYHFSRMREAFVCGTTKKPFACHMKPVPSFPLFLVVDMLGKTVTARCVVSGSFGADELLPLCGSALPEARGHWCRTFAMPEMPQFCTKRTPLVVFGWARTHLIEWSPKHSCSRFFIWLTREHDVFGWTCAQDA